MKICNTNPMRVLLIFYVILGLLFIGCKSQLQTDVITKNRSKVLEKINSDSLRQLNQVQGLGLTILHTAVVANDQTVVKALISRKINLDTKTTSIRNSGLTALHIAVQEEFVEIVELLLKAGADKEIKFKNLTALDLAYFTRNQKIIELLNKY